MNKQELISKIADDTGYDENRRGRGGRSMIEGIIKTLKKGQTITFVGFGTFKTSIRKARMGRNPQTGAAVKIPKRRVVRFSAGKGAEGRAQLNDSSEKANGSRQQALRPFAFPRVPPYTWPFVSSLIFPHKAI